LQFFRSVVSMNQSVTLSQSRSNVLQTKPRQEIRAAKGLCQHNFKFVLPTLSREPLRPGFEFTTSEPLPLPVRLAGCGRQSVWSPTHHSRRFGDVKTGRMHCDSSGSCHRYAPWQHERGNGPLHTRDGLLPGSASSLLGGTHPNDGRRSASISNGQTDFLAS
jgi:hypothetical protein